MITRISITRLHRLSYTIVIFFFSITFLFAQEDEEKKKEPIKTSATLPVEMFNYNVVWGNHEGSSITKDSLILLASQKIKVKENNSGTFCEVISFFMTHSPHQQDPVMLKATGNQLTDEMKKAISHAGTGDVFYVDVKFLNKANEKLSTIMAVKVK